MPGPHPATAAIRYAVRSAVRHCAPGHRVAVAASGGADSMALAGALAFEAPQAGLSAAAIVVDHGLQEGSARVAQEAAERLRGLGIDTVEVREVDVVGGGRGVEAAAREARYAALESVATEVGAALVLLGHTRDDQAEQVLLGLTRGAGARSLSGMPARRGRFVRPLLKISRAQTLASCRAEGWEFWEDPMNSDRAFTRVRARRALVDLERDLGPGVVAALARSAELLRADADYLQAQAEQAARELGEAPWPVDQLLAVPAALRGRVWRRLLVAAGAPAGSVSTRHTDACEALLTRWHGQGPLDVPGRFRVARRAGLIWLLG